MSYINKYYPKRPITSFQDLQVYQITLALAVDIVKKEIDTDYFEKQIKGYLKVRGQILRLQKSWIKFIPPKNHA